jgi:membrane protease subunit (stomatin/prohibitin family)
LAANYDELGRFITDRIVDDFKKYGLELTRLLVENISLPETVEEALDKRSSMGVIGNLQQYAQFQAANAMEKAAENEQGLAGGGMGMGLGFAMANQMGQSMTQPPPQGQAPQYFAGINGQQAGPFDLDGLRLQIQSGQITGETLVWPQGMAQWTPAGEVSMGAVLFPATPPPLPPR